MKDFFWDDDFRFKWDAMLAYSKILEEFPENGTMIVQWIKKVLPYVLINNVSKIAMLAVNGMTSYQSLEKLQ